MQLSSTFGIFTSVDVTVVKQPLLFFFLFYRNITRVLKGLDPDQDQCSVGTDSGLNKGNQQTTIVAASKKQS